MMPDPNDLAGLPQDEDFADSETLGNRQFNALVVLVLFLMAVLTVCAVICHLAWKRAQQEQAQFQQASEWAVRR